MKVDKKILICGGGIAGPACAYWLHRYGYSVVMAEKANALRDGGQNVDIKGAGQRVIKLMGLAEAVEAKNTLECGQKYIDAKGDVVSSLPRGAFGTLTSDFEILRGDLAHVLFDATKNDCEYRFGKFVTRLDERDGAMAVTFNDGAVEEFEFVICAEGISSSSRDMVLADKTHFRYLGAYMAFFKIPRRPEDDCWARTVNGVGGTFITLRPGNDQETTVLVTFRRDDPEISGDKRSTRKELLSQALAGRGTIADRIAADLETVQDFYFGPMSQVQASAWSKGRFVLLGDAAHCPTPFTGQGTALSLVGAYLLAGEIKRNASYADAFAAYDRLLRPYVEASQKRLSPGTIRLFHPRTAFQISLMHLAVRFVGSKPVQTLLKPSPAKRERNVAEDFDLPNYD
jgi:2-polyprenyl-6-methoxyphenol hydroxylase-like FAD-dependent oxidoreductase